MWYLKGTPEYKELKKRKKAGEENIAKLTHFAILQKTKEREERERETLRSMEEAREALCQLRKNPPKPPRGCVSPQPYFDPPSPPRSLWWSPLPPLPAATTTTTSPPSRPSLNLMDDYEEEDNDNSSTESAMGSAVQEWLYKKQKLRERRVRLLEDKQKRKAQLSLPLTPIHQRGANNNNNLLLPPPQPVTPAMAVGFSTNPPPPPLPPVVVGTSNKIYRHGLTVARVTTTTHVPIKHVRFREEEKEETKKMEP